MSQTKRDMIQFLLTVFGWIIAAQVLIIWFKPYIQSSPIVFLILGLALMVFSGSIARSIHNG